MVSNKFFPNLLESVVEDKNYSLCSKIHQLENRSARGATLV